MNRLDVAVRPMKSLTRFSAVRGVGPSGSPGFMRNLGAFETVAALRQAVHVPIRPRADEI
jgi:hypothetical protein